MAPAKKAQRFKSTRQRTKNGRFSAASIIADEPVPLPLNQRAAIEGHEQRWVERERAEYAALDAEVLALEAAAAAEEQRRIEAYEAELEAGVRARAFQVPPYGDPRHRDLYRLYPTIEDHHFTSIENNTFHPPNILKLSTAWTPRERRSYIRNMITGQQIEIPPRDAEIEEATDLLKLMRCLLLYNSILLFFTPRENFTDLSMGLSAYTDRLFALAETHTWESVRAFHFIFHNKRVCLGDIHEGKSWGYTDRHLEMTHLVEKRMMVNVAMRDERVERVERGGVCRRWNTGNRCVANCRYRHVCDRCEGRHRVLGCDGLL